VHGRLLSQERDCQPCRYSARSNYCKPCPLHAVCDEGTTVEDLGVPRGYWRASPFTTEVHRCDSSIACVGSSRSARRSLAGVPTERGYCEQGHAGPRCEMCVEDRDYFDGTKCVACPSSRRRFGTLVGVSAAALLLAATAHALTRRLQPTSGLARRSAALRNRLRRGFSFQCKFKVTVSFAQVCSVLGPVYGVSLHPDFQPSLSWLDKTGWDLIDLTYPGTCLGPMRTRMLLGALWPYAAVAALSFFLGAVSLTPSCLAELARPPTQRPAHREVSQSGSAVGAHRSLLRVRSLLFKKQPPVERARAVEQSPSLMTRRLSGHLYSNLYLLVFILYLVLPLVSNAIFEARLCESFSYDDTSGLRISFLLADLSLRCNSGPTWSSQTTSLDPYFWTLFTLWTNLVPSCFLVLLLKVRSERRALRTSQIASSTRFLWHDYRDEFLFWEIVDLWRKVRARVALSLACSTHPTTPNPPLHTTRYRSFSLPSCSSSTRRKAPIGY